MLDEDVVAKKELRSCNCLQVFARGTARGSPLPEPRPATTVTAFSYSLSYFHKNLALISHIKELLGRAPRSNLGYRHNCETIGASNVSSKKSETLRGDLDWISCSLLKVPVQMTAASKDSQTAN